MYPVIFALVLAAGLGCHRKAAPAAALDPQQVAIDSMASFALLQDIEAEDPYLAAALTEDDIEQEAKKRAEQIRQEADGNQNGKIDPEEMGRLKALVKDRMLEQFDIDSDGSFNEAEHGAIREKIHARIEAAREQARASES